MISLPVLPIRRRVSGRNPFGGNQMAIRSLAALAALFTLAFAGDSAAQSSFDCRQPRSDTVAIICRDPDFSARDQQIDQAYRTALEQAPEPQRVRDNHAAWARSILVCGDDRGCISRSLDEELTALEYAAASGRRGVEVAAAEDPKPQPFYGAAPPLERKPAESSPTFLEGDRSTAVESGPADSLLMEAPRHDETISQQQPEPAEAYEPSPSEQADLPTKSSRLRNTTTGLAIGGLFILPILAVVVALLVVRSLANYTTNRYGWPLIMNWWNLFHLVGFFGGVFVGSMGVQTGAAIPMGLGFFGACWAIVLLKNITKTNLLTGLAMTIVQPLVVAILWVIYGVTKAKAEGRRI